MVWANLTRSSNGRSVSLKITFIPLVILFFILLFTFLFSTFHHFNKLTVKLECTKHPSETRLEDNDCEITRSPPLLEFQFEIIDLIVEISTPNSTNFTPTNFYYNVNPISNGEKIEFVLVDISLKKELKNEHLHVYVKDDTNLKKIIVDADDQPSYAPTMWSKIASVQNNCKATILLESNDKNRVYPLFTYPCKELGVTHHHVHRTTPNIFNKKPAKLPQTELKDTNFLHTVKTTSKYLYDCQHNSNNKFHLDLSIGNEGGMVWLLLLLALLGAGFFITTSEIWIFDGERGLFGRRQRNILGVNVKSWNIQLGHVRKVVVERQKVLNVKVTRMRNSNQNLARGNVYQLIVLMDAFFNREKKRFEIFYQENNAELLKFAGVINDCLVANGNVLPSEQPEEENEFTSQSSGGGTLRSRRENCVVCLHVKPNVLLIPCRHLCVCDGCSAKVETCPLCRKKIEERMDIFVS